MTSGNNDPNELLDPRDLLGRDETPLVTGLPPTFSFEDLVKTYFGTFLLSARMALELNQVETAAHNDRVSEYSGKLASLLGKSDEEIQDLKDAAILHDIGKIFVSDLIALDRSLNEEEDQRMKMHPYLGASYVDTYTAPLRAQSDLLVDPRFHLTSLISFCHHGFVNGKGYPSFPLQYGEEGKPYALNLHGSSAHIHRPLEGEENPIEALIVGFSDYLDALLFPRNYRGNKAYSFEEVQALVQRDDRNGFTGEERWGQEIISAFFDGDFGEYVRDRSKKQLPVKGHVVEGVVLSS